jgi:hypothetical protein
MVRLGLRSWFGRYPDIQKEMIMIDGDEGFLPADWQFAQWPTDMRQRAFEVIATTRYEWLSRDCAGESVADRARFAQPSFGLALDVSPQP